MTYKQKIDFEPILAWPIHVFQFKPADFLYQSFFAEPQWVIRRRHVNWIGGTRLSFASNTSSFYENILIVEGGGIYSSREHGGFISFGLGRSDGSHGDFNKFGIIARCIKTNREIRGDITIDYWPSQYLP